MEDEVENKIFSQIREEQWVRRVANGEKRYAHGRKAKRGQLLGGRDGRAYKAR